MKHKQKGFTLIELILVTAIIGLFAAGVIAVINPTTQVAKANDAKRKGDLEAISRALEGYYADHGRYPSASSNEIFTTVLVDWGTSWQPYIDVLPKDPASSKKYIYAASADGQRYGVYASLDKGSGDPQACHTNGSYCDSLVTFDSFKSTGKDPSTACGGICSFGVTSADISP